MGARGLVFLGLVSVCMPQVSSQELPPQWPTPAPPIEVLRLQGSVAGSFGFARAVAGAGDIDGDGSCDLAVGASGASDDAPRGAVRVYSGRDGSLIRTLVDGRASFCLGWHLAPAGDLDHDGLPELVVHAQGRFFEFEPSSLSVISCRDGRVLHTWASGETRDFFGHTAAPVGDVDGDGAPDVAAGAFAGDERAVFLFFETRSPPFARVYSGRTGQALWTREGSDDGFRFGETVCAAGDVDADGSPDVAVAELPGAYSTGGPSPSGRVWIVSGRDGSVLRRIDSTLDTDPFGGALAFLGDVDGDGGPELAIGSDEYPASFVRAQHGYVRVVSLRDGRTLWTARGRARFDAFARTLAALPDWNGDGAADLAVGAEQHGCPVVAIRPGYVQVLSGKDGRVLASISGEHHWDDFGGGLADAGDVDGDCRPDLLVGAPGAAEGRGLAFVLSGAALMAQQGVAPTR